MPRSNETYKLGSELGCLYLSGAVCLYDIRGYSAQRITSIADEEMEQLTAWYYEGRCPICGTDIADGEIICNECYQQASQHPARADQIHIREQRMFQRGRQASRQEAQ